MIIEIIRKVSSKIEIDVELPYYYKHHLESDYSKCVIYGKIDVTEQVTIEQTTGNICSYKIEHELYDSIANSGLECYFDLQYASSKTEFDVAAQRAKSFLDILLL